MNNKQLGQALTKALSKAIVKDKEKGIYKCKCGAWHNKGSKCTKSKDVMNGLWY